MSRRYKFLNPEGIYFVSFATVNWIDVFVRPVYHDILVQNLIYCKNNFGLNLYSWCIMPSHVHLVFRAIENNPSILIGRFKEYTSKQLVKTIQQNIQESRRVWMLPMFREAGSKSSNVQLNQFWQHDSHPIELWSPEVFNQKVEYVHNNPVVSGFVEEPCHWKYSSAINYSGGKGLIEIDFF